MSTPEELVATDDVIVLRLHGRPRSALDGRHRKLVIYTQATMDLLDVVEALREAADRLQRPVQPPTVSPTTFL